MVIEVALLLPFVINYYAMVLLWSNNNKHEMRLLYVALSNIDYRLQTNRTGPEGSVAVHEKAQQTTE